MTWLTENTAYILQAFWVTVRIAFLSGVISLVLGTLLTTLAISPVPVMRTASRTYVNTLRNTPLTLLMFFCSFGLWQNLGVQFSDRFTVNNLWLAVTGLSAYTAAFVCEALRAGVNTIAQGQVEAARSLGLTFVDTLRHVVLPQAGRRMIGPMGSVYSAMVKNTTVAAAIGVGESALVMKEMIENYGNEVLSVFLGFAFGFMCLALPIGVGSSRLAERWAVRA